MKKIISFSVLICLALCSAAFVFAKGGGKGKDKKPSDGVVRKYKSKPVKKPVAVTLDSGVQYTITSKGDGPQIKKGDRVKVLYVGKLTNDTVFDASYLHNNVPLPFHVGMHEVIPGWDSALVHLHGGDKATVRIPPSMGYGSMQRGKIPPNSTIIFEVEIIEICVKPTPWDAKGKDTITTPSGLKMVMYESHPDSIMPKNGNKVTVHYSGFLANDSMFDSSVEREQPYTFVLGRDRVIKGWYEGITLMHKGEKAKLIIPYQLGYGESGIPPVIPPKATLIFDVQLLDVK
ncbi:MAG TPA: FKBP-type peptidyl-prolyl cis-trans isomerase [Bacteroidia bacterium]|nr:FKBP-type peptidyl-prolyl cis-trans isomerase [Bacteroidia bacterium]